MDHDGYSMPRLVPRCRSAADLRTRVPVPVDLLSGSTGRSTQPFIPFKLFHVINLVAVTIAPKHGSGENMAAAESTSLASGEGDMVR